MTSISNLASASENTNICLYISRSLFVEYENDLSLHHLLFIYFNNILCHEHSVGVESPKRLLANKIEAHRHYPSSVE